MSTTANTDESEPLVPSAGLSGSLTPSFPPSPKTGVLIVAIIGPSKVCNRQVILRPTQWGTGVMIVVSCLGGTGAELRSGRPQRVGELRPQAAPAGKKRKERKRKEKKGKENLSFIPSLSSSHGTE